MRPYCASKNDFACWLNQYVWVDGDEKAMRRDYIVDVAEDLTEWMAKKGYVMDHRWKRGHMAVARWLYALSVREIAQKAHNAPVTYPEVLHRSWEEDFHHYYSIINSAAIEEFFSRWEFVEDFDKDMPLGLRIRQEFQQFLYVYLNLDSSKQGKIVERRLEQDVDSDSDGGGGGREHRGNKKDSYLQDIDEGFHSGYW
jgi:hypothetical protein